MSKRIRVMPPRGYYAQIPRGLREWADKMGITPHQLWEVKDRAVEAWKNRPRADVNGTHDVMRGGVTHGAGDDFDNASVGAYCDPDSTLEHDGHIGIAKLISGARFKGRTRKPFGKASRKITHLPEDQFFVEDPEYR